MDKFIIKGGKPLKGVTTVSGAKNVSLKAVVAACLTEEKITIKNVPLISDLLVMIDIIRYLGGEVEIKDHAVSIQVKHFAKAKIPLDKAAKVRTSCMFLSPILARLGEVEIPNPGGCRIGARPIDRIIKGLNSLGANIVYNRNDGYFYAKTERLIGAEYSFDKNTHMGTETLLLAAVLAKGKTVLKNAAEEPEVDELIALLNKMGSSIKRIEPRTIVVNGVDKLHGTTFTVGPDRNEAVTLAVAALITKGDVFIKNIRPKGLREFLVKLREAGGGVEMKKNGIRVYSKGAIRAVDVQTSYYPGFMTDWQGPWALLMTYAKGVSVIHEAVYENRFGYVKELIKMGAKIKLYNPKINNPQSFYNFNIEDDRKEYFHAAKVYGPVRLHNAVVEISDLRAGATLVLAALAARGESVIYGIEHLDRGYEKFEENLKSLGANIKRKVEER